MSARRPFVAGNWKLNGGLASARALAGEVVAGAGSLAADVVVCPPVVHLPAVATVLEGGEVMLGAQNAAPAQSGAMTGEVAPAMLAELGVRHVILGHSERRSLFHESDADVAARMAAVLEAGLVPILCVGETREEREAGEVDAVIDRQLQACIETVGIEAFASAVVAYEPVWAIGTGLTATPEQAQAVHAMIRTTLTGLDASIGAGLRIVYGGSMKPGNAAELLSQPDIDGGLIGGAALVADDFLAICRAAGSR